jgi:hypothetical protein
LVFYAFLAAVKLQFLKIHNAVGYNADKDIAIATVS